MTRRHHTELVREGQYVAEAEANSEEGWSPYLSLEDAKKLDEVRESLRRGDLKRAGQPARVYELTPVSV